MAVTDEITHACGPFGKYQIFQISMAYFTSIMAGQQFLVVTFHNYEPESRCALPGWPNDTYAIQSEEHNATITALISDGGCLVNGSTCMSYVYSREKYPGATIVSQFNLVCGNRPLATISTTLFTVGLMIGSLVCGIVSDRIGRRHTMLGASVTATCGSCALIFTQNMYMYISLRMLVGACFTGAMLVAACLALEITAPSHRTVAVMYKASFWPVGIASLSLIAYFLPDWNHIQIVLTIGCVISTVLVLVFVNETPQYLISKGKHEEAVKILKIAARWNGKTPDDSIFERLREEEQAAQKEKISELFKSPVLLKRCLICFYLWGIAALGYYGLSFNVKNMVGNLYINNLLSATMDFAQLAPTFLTKVIGRKPPYLAGMFIGAASLLATAMFIMFLDLNDYVKEYITVTMLGKLCLNFVFTLDYFWCAEVFPTTLRSSLMGISSFCARIGSILSPILVDMYKYVDTPLQSGLGPLIFCVTMIVGGILAFFLPETNNCRIPETIEEANQRSFKRLTPDGSSHFTSSDLSNSENNIHEEATLGEMTKL